MIREAEIIAKIAAVLADQLSLADLEEWIGPASRNMHKDSSPEAQDLASRLLFLLDEYGYGMVSETQMRKDLQGFPLTHAM